MRARYLENNPAVNYNKFVRPLENFVWALSFLCWIKISQFCLHYLKENFLRFFAIGVFSSYIKHIFIYDPKYAGNLSKKRAIILRVLIFVPIYLKKCMDVWNNFYIVVISKHFLEV